MRGLLVVLGLLLAAAPAAALGTSLAVDLGPLDEALRPGGSSAEVPVEVTWCRAAPDVDDVEVALAVVEAPPWIVATLSVGEVRFDGPEPSPQACRTEQATLSLRATRDAPAFTPAVVRVAAAYDGSALHDPAGAENGLLVVARWVGALDAAPEPERVAYERGPAEAALRLMNLGNGNTVFRFEVVEAPDGVQVALPAPLALEAKPTGGRAVFALVPFEFHHPAAGDVVVRVASAYALDRALVGPSATVRWTLEPEGVVVQSFAAPGAGRVPLPVWTAAAGALAGLALYARRR